jgi:hypothetical protein
LVPTLAARSVEPKVRPLVKPSVVPSTINAG